MDLVAANECDYSSAEIFYSYSQYLVESILFRAGAGINKTFCRLD